MKPRLSLVLAVLVGGLGAGCAGHTRYNPFIVPQDRIYGSVKTIALGPVCTCGGPRELEQADLSRGKFDSLLTAALSSAGFAVVPPAETQAIWEHVTDSLGGIFDAATGQRDTVKFNTARSLTMQQLRKRFHADAWLHPIIVLTGAKFAGGEATWDGTTQSFQSFGKKLLGAMFGGTYGKTPALSVLVMLEDMTGRELYRNQGGLQLYEMPSGNTFVPVLRSELYADAVRNAIAVRLALAPLTTHTPAASVVGGMPRP
jgi:hypothetical protein